VRRSIGEVCPNEPVVFDLSGSVAGLLKNATLRVREKKTRVTCWERGRTGLTTAFSGTRGKGGGRRIFGGRGGRRVRGGGG